MNDGRKFMYYAENFVLFVVEGFYRLVLHALRLRHRYRRTMRFYYVSNTNTK